MLLKQQMDYFMKDRGFPVFTLLRNAGSPACYCNEWMDAVSWQVDIVINYVVNDYYEESS